MSYLNHLCNWHRSTWLSVEENRGRASLYTYILGGGWMMGWELCFSYKVLYTTTRHDEFNILCRIVFGSAQLFQEFKWSVLEVSVFRVLHVEMHVIKQYINRQSRYRKLSCAASNDIKLCFSGCGVHLL